MVCVREINICDFPHITKFDLYIFIFDKENGDFYDYLSYYI